MSELVVNGLVRKRAELAGAIEHTQTQLKQMIANVGSLDAAIRVFNPDYKLEGIKAKAFRTSTTKRGDLTRALLNALREAIQPMPTSEIAKGIGSSPHRTGIALDRQRKKGVVRATRKEGGENSWEIVRCSP